MKEDIRKLVENKSKTQLYNLYHSNKITLDELCVAIFEISEIATCYQSFKKTFFTIWE